MDPKLDNVLGPKGTRQRTPMQSSTPTERRGERKKDEKGRKRKKERKKTERKEIIWG